MSFTTVSTRACSTISTKSKSNGKGNISITANSEFGGGGSYLVSLFLNKGSALTDQELGFCAIDLHTFYCSLTQFADTRSYVRTLHKLSIYPPSKLIIPSTMFQQNQAESDLILFLKENLGEVLHVHPEPRHFFTSITGHNFIQHLALPEQLQSLELALQEKTAALSSLGGLFKHIENTMGIFFAKESVNFHLEPISGTMMIDTFTARTLELVTSTLPAQSKTTLFDTLNFTKTMMGARLLRWTILQPLTDLETIENRLDAVDELSKNEMQYIKLSNALKDIPNVEALISALIMSPKNSPSAKKAEINITSLINLQKLISSIPSLRDALQHTESKLLKNALQIFSDERVEIMQEALSKVIDPSVSVSEFTPIGMRNQRCFAVKSGLNGFLDVSRQAYRETTNDIHALVQEYSDLYRLPLKMAFNASQGFQLEIRRTPYEKQSFPSAFINLVHKQKTTYCTTLDLLKLNERIKESIEEIYLLSDRIIDDLIETLRQNIGVLYHISESISLMDILSSFAHCANIYEYSRPTFSDTLGLQASRHPMKEKLNTYVPNDTFIDSGCNIQLITGPNMSGKTIYLKQVALNVIMAQSGCFCAAKFAMIRITHHLFTVMSFSDSIQTNASSFMVEMRGAAYILQNIRNDSLVLMDELGRGTSCRDALGIAFAIIEFLARTKAFVLFATHFHLLTNALQIYPNVVNLHFNIQYNGREMKFLHKIEDGECKQHGYGLDLASSMDFPESVLKHAQRISRTLHLQKPTPLSKESVKARLYHEIAHRLKSIVTHSQLKAEALTSYLTRFQQEGRELIKELEEKEAESSSHSPNMTNDNGVKSPSSFNLSQLNSLTNAFNELQENYEDNHLMLPSESNLENDPETTEPKNEPYPSLLFLTTPTNSSPFITVLPSNGQNKMNSLPTPDSHIITAVNTNKHDSIYLDVAKYLGSSPNSVSTEETVSSCTDVTREVRSVTPDNASTLYVLMKSKKREIDKVEEDNMIEESRFEGKKKSLYNLTELQPPILELNKKREVKPSAGSKRKFM